MIKNQKITNFKNSHNFKKVKVSNQKNKITNKYRYIIQIIVMNPMKQTIKSNKLKKVILKILIQKNLKAIPITKKTFYQQKSLT